MSFRRARDLLAAMAAFAGTDAFEEAGQLFACFFYVTFCACQGLSGCLQAASYLQSSGIRLTVWDRFVIVLHTQVGTARHESLLRKLWEPACSFLGSMTESMKSWK